MLPVAFWCKAFKGMHPPQEPHFGPYTIEQRAHQMSQSASISDVLQLLSTSNHQNAASISPSTNAQHPKILTCEILACANCSMHAPNAAWTCLLVLNTQKIHPQNQQLTVVTVLTHLPAGAQHSENPNQNQKHECMHRSAGAVCCRSRWTAAAAAEKEPPHKSHNTLRCAPVCWCCRCCSRWIAAAAAAVPRSATTTSGPARKRTPCAASSSRICGHAFTDNGMKMLH
eukprot:1158233-Pelagomonas_calceolata.AAC.2